MKPWQLIEKLDLTNCEPIANRCGWSIYEHPTNAECFVLIAVIEQTASNETASLIGMCFETNSYEVDPELWEQIYNMPTPQSRHAFLPTGQRAHIYLEGEPVK